MTDAFKKWIDAMSEDEYVDRIESEVDDGGFTDAQLDKALNIREPPEDDDYIDMKRRQAFDINPAS